MTKPAKIIPPSVVRRLTRYLAHLQEVREEGTEWVSSQGIAETLGLTSSTVRQDLSHLDCSGISKRGYETGPLERVLARVLGADRAWRVVVVGIGNLGRALALHEEFPRRGFEICGVFDADPRKIGKKVGKLVVRSIEEVPAVVRAEKVDIGIIAVPPSAAQSVADVLIEAGVRGLLNLALTHIVAPKRVAVTNSRIVAAAMELTHAIKFLPKESLPKRKPGP